MFRRLRISFILIATLAVSASLFLFSSVLNSTYYLNNERQITRVLNLLTDNGGELSYNSKTSSQLGVNSEDGLYQYRYFSFVFDKNGQLQRTSTDRIASLSREDIGAIAQKLANLSDDIGTLTLGETTYSYQKSDFGKGQTLIVVLDSSQYYRETNHLIHLTYLMSGISFILFAFIFTLFSGKVIKPFVRNYEKQRRFITNAGHELKTPLAIISANNELVELMNGESEWTKSTADQVTRLTGLINGLVSLARLEEQAEVTLTDLDFSAIAEDAAEDFKGPVVRDGKIFKMQIQPGIHVKAEEKSLFELVTLLVDNANKYCDPEGTVQVKLTKNRLKRARLEISNTYAAGKDVDYSKFFERFYREDESHNNQKKSGYGIGLSMAQSMVKLFKGSISVNYKDDTITFVVFL